MTASSGGVTKRLLEELISDQERRAAQERKMSFAEKLKVLDQLMSEGNALSKTSGMSPQRPRPGKTSRGQKRRTK